MLLSLLPSLVHSGLTFSQSVLEDRSPEVMATIRCQRLVSHGKWIAEQFPSLNLMNVKEEKPGRVHFSSATPMVKVVPGKMCDGRILHCTVDWMKMHLHSTWQFV